MSSIAGSKALYLLRLPFLTALLLIILVPAAAFSSSWHNSALPADVDGDGKVSGLDSVIIKDYLDNYGSINLQGIDRPAGAPFIDVTNDNFFSAIDRLTQWDYVLHSGQVEQRVPFANGQVRIAVPIEAGKQYLIYLTDTQTMAAVSYDINKINWSVPFLTMGSSYMWHVEEVDPLGNGNKVIDAASFPCSALITEEGVLYNGTAENDILKVDIDSAGYHFALQQENGQPSQPVVYPEQNFFFDGVGGQNRIELATYGNDDWILINYARIEHTYTTAAISYSNVQHIKAVGHGNADCIQMYAPVGKDIFTAYPYVSTLRDEAGTYEFEAVNYRYMHGYASGGDDDKAFLHGTNLSDKSVSVLDSYTKLFDLAGTQYYLRAKYFHYVEVLPYGGDNQAYLYDTSKNDYLKSTAGESVFCTYKTGIQPDLNNLCSDPSVQYKTVKMNYFRYTYAYAQYGGNDTAQFYDTAAQDSFKASSSNAYMYDAAGQVYFSRAYYFETNSAYSVMGGGDDAYIYDSPGYDYVYGDPTLVYMQSGNIFNSVNAFRWVHVYGTSGSTGQRDRADIYGFADDTYYCRYDTYCRRYDSPSSWDYGTYHIRVKQGFNVNYPDLGFSTQLIN